MHGLIVRPLLTLRPQVASLVGLQGGKNAAVAGFVLPGPTPLHHFDPSDVANAWGDTAGTTPASDGVDVKRMDNLGSDGTNVVEEGAAQNPVYRTGVINGLNAVEFTHKTTGTRLGATIVAGHAKSTLGMSFMMVLKTLATVGGGTDFYFHWLLDGLGQSGANMRAFIGGTSATNIGAVADDTWYLAYGSTRAGDFEDYYYLSGAAEAKISKVDGTDIGASQTLRFQDGPQAGYQVAEAACWGSDLTTQERADLVTYATDKYGTLPLGP